MKPQATHSKGVITNKMLRNVSVLWDARSTENIDPIVKLPIESLSSEIFKLFGEFSDVEDRLLFCLAIAMRPTTYIYKFN